MLTIFFTYEYIGYYLFCDRVNVTLSIILQNTQINNQNLLIMEEMLNKLTKKIIVKMKK